MSFNISDSSRFAKDKSLLCDYYDCSIYFNQYERTPNNGGCVKIPYFTPENVVKPNGLFISSEPTKKYMSSSLQIYKKTHDIGGIDYDGELVIENKQITNGDSKLFVCFPLKTMNIQPNEIDKIITKSEKSNSNELKMNVNVNSMFNKLQKYIFYKSDNDIVVVFTEPINVYTMFDKFVPCNLFSSYNNSYNILQNVPGKDQFQSITEGFVEGIDSGEMDCTPIDVTTNQPLTDLPTIVGLNSGSDSQNKTINLLFAMIMFVIILSVSIVGGPPLYKYVFKTRIEDTNLKFTFLFVLFYLCWSFLGMTIGGFIIKDGATSLAGIFFTVLIGISGIISYLVLSTDTDFADYSFFGTKSEEIKETFIWLLFENGWLFKYFGDFFSLFSNPSSKYFYGHIVAGISIIISSIFLGLVTNKKNKDKSKRNLAGQKDEAKRKNFAIAMISVFGLFSAIFIVGPFVGFITGQ